MEEEAEEGGVEDVVDIGGDVIDGANPLGRLDAVDEPALEDDKFRLWGSFGAAGVAELVDEVEPEGDEWVQDK